MGRQEVRRGASLMQNGGTEGRGKEERPLRLEMRATQPAVREATQWLQIISLTEKVSGLENERDVLMARNAGLEDQIRKLSTQIAALEPELRRLQSDIEHSRYQKEARHLRSRVMIYAEHVEQAGQRIVKLEQKLAEAEHVSQTWYRPELERLGNIVADYDKTKQEWWDPQLELRAARIQELEATITKLTERAEKTCTKTTS